MEKNQNKESYMQRRTQQLQQWDRVIAKLIARADKAKDIRQKDLRHHILKIQVLKARTEVKLRQLREVDNGDWDIIKTGLENNWTTLRKAFLKASARAK